MGRAQTLPRHVMSLLVLLCGLHFALSSTGAHTELPAFDALLSWLRERGGEPGAWTMSQTDGVRGLQLGAPVEDGDVPVVVRVTDNATC